MNRAPSASEEISPWFLVSMGVMDHAYENCPAIQKELAGERKRWQEAKDRFDSWKARIPSLEFEVKYPEIHEGVGSLDPDLEMCGWCARVWKARNRRSA